VVHLSDLLVKVKTAEFKHQQQAKKNTQQSQQPTAKSAKQE
jgi:hypothetical protein